MADNGTSSLKLATASSIRLFNHCLIGFVYEADGKGGTEKVLLDTHEPMAILFVSSLSPTIRDPTHDTSTTDRAVYVPDPPRRQRPGTSNDLCIDAPYVEITYRFHRRSFALGQCIIANGCQSLFHCFSFALILVLVYASSLLAWVLKEKTKSMTQISCHISLHISGSHLASTSCVLVCCMNFHVLC
jgi:hypothetical protein